MVTVVRSTNWANQACQIEQRSIAGLNRRPYDSNLSFGFQWRRSQLDDSGIEPLTFSVFGNQLNALKQERERNEVRALPGLIRRPIGNFLEVRKPQKDCSRLLYHWAKSPRVESERWERETSWQIEPCVYLEVVGIDPTASCMRSTRSTIWATPPLKCVHMV